MDSTTPPSFSLKQAVVTLEHKAWPDGVYIEDILATFGSRSHAFLILFLSLPFVQPMPLFGLSTPLGFAILLLGVFLILGRKPWLPHKFMRLHLKAGLVKSCCSALIQVLNRTEKIFKPRFSSWAATRGVRWLNGALIVIYALLLSLPLPVPFSNSIPAYFLILNALGLLEEDGLLLLISYLVAIAGFVFFGGLALGAVEAFDWARTFLHQS